MVMHNSFISTVPTNKQVCELTKEMIEMIYLTWENVISQAILLIMLEFWQ